MVVGEEGGSPVEESISEMTTSEAVGILATEAMAEATLGPEVTFPVVGAPLAEVMRVISGWNKT